MAKVLVTGLSGFTGQFLKWKLEMLGHQVVGLYDVSQPNIRVNLSKQHAVTEAVLSINPDMVVHLAAVAFVAHDNIDEIYHTNLLGTQHLLKAIQQMEQLPSHILIASSANIYGNTDVGIITEDILPCPANDYAVSKLAMEYMVHTWCNKLPITIVRPFNYTGVGQNEQFLIPKIIKHFKKKTPIIELGNLDVVRDFSDVRDVVDVYAKILEQKATGDVYNVCSGFGASLLEIIEIMKQLSGHNIDIKVNPNFIRANEVKQLIGSNNKISNLIGDINQYSLRDTLEWMYNN